MLCVEPFAKLNTDEITVRPMTADFQQEFNKILCLCSFSVGIQQNIVSVPETVVENTRALCKALRTVDDVGSFSIRLYYRLAASRQEFNKILYLYLNGCREYEGPLQSTSY